MTDSKDTRTKEQLLAEIEALRDQLAARGSNVGKPVSGGSTEPIFSVPITRRELFGRALVSWVSPVILSVPVGVTALITPGTAQALATRSPTAKPKAAPTSMPTMSVAPTAVPVPGPGVIGLAALGSALAASGAKLLMDRMGASDADGSQSGDGSGGDKGSK